VTSLLVASAVPGEGKTTVALNLAIAEAIAGNPKVLLLEADFRRPALAERLRIQSRPGIAEVLSRNVSLDAALQYVHVPGAASRDGETPTFAVLTAGLPRTNPTELVESVAMVELLATLSERFDLIVLDSPPMSVMPDAIPLTRLVSGVVIVSRLRVTTRDAAHRLRDQLRKLQAHTLGVIANAAPDQRPWRDHYTYGSQPPAQPLPHELPLSEADDADADAARGREVSPSAGRSRLYYVRRQSAGPSSFRDSSS
jgi:capsular exopolysaccharide synthesis family protein